MDQESKIDSPVFEQLAKFADKESIKERARKSKPGYRIKQYAWRVTALYLWLRFLPVFFGAPDLFYRFEARAIQRFVELLSSLGFAPGNPDYIPTIVKGSWILLITAFKPLEIVGMIVYVFFFPVTLIFYVLFAKAFNRPKKEKAKKTQASLTFERQPFQMIAPLTLAFLGWFLLFGDSPSKHPLFLGVFLSGLLLVAVGYRVFLRARPMIGAESVPGWFLIGNAYHLAISLQKKLEEQEKKKEPVDQSNTPFDLKIYGPMWRMLRRAALLTRGPRGQNRAALYILGEYVMSMLLLGSLATLFWALMIRSVALPVQLQLSLCLHWSASYFLPSVGAPATSASIPIWIGVGAGVTAWILLVLFVSVAASQLPGHQRSFAKRIIFTYRYLRFFVVFFGRYVRKLKQNETEAPKSTTG